MQIFSLLLAIFLPLLVVMTVMWYLRSALSSILIGLCGRKEYADFWTRSATILALSASWVLTLLFSSWDSNDANFIFLLRQQLLLVAGGIFISSGWIARSVWKSVLSNTHGNHCTDTTHPIRHTS